MKNATPMRSGTYLDWMKATIETLVEINEGNLLGENVPSPFTPDFHMLVGAIGDDVMKDGRADEVEAAIEKLRKYLNTLGLEQGFVVLALFTLTMQVYMDSIDFARKTYISKGMSNEPRAN